MFKKSLVLFLFALISPQIALAEQSVYYQVPFVSQAPLGNWKDAVFKDACEETSLLMAEAWIMGQQLDPKLVEDRLHDIAVWELLRFGFHQDTSVADTNVIAQEYLHLPTQFEENIDVNDIKQAIGNKYIVITAIAGDKLYYKGPPRHMIVITGFDAINNEYVYSDPMKPQGDNLRISPEKLQSILRDYPSGVHKKVNNVRTAMLKVGWPWILGP